MKILELIIESMFDAEIEMEAKKIADAIKKSPKPKNDYIDISSYAPESLIARLQKGSGKTSNQVKNALYTRVEQLMRKL